MGKEVFNWKVKKWWEHPEHIELGRKAKLPRASGAGVGACPQWLIDQVKAERGNGLLLP